MASFGLGKIEADLIDKKITSTLIVRLIYCVIIFLFFLLLYIPTIFNNVKIFFTPVVDLTSADHFAQLSDTDRFGRIYLDNTLNIVTSEQAGLSEEITSQQIKGILNSNQNGAELDEGGNLFMWFYKRNAVLVPMDNKIMVVFIYDNQSLDNGQSIFVNVKSVSPGAREYFSRIFSDLTGQEVANTIYAQQVNEPSMPVIPLVSCLFAIALSIYFFVRNLKILRNQQLHPVNKFFEDYPQLSKDEASYELFSGDAVCVTKNLYLCNGWLMYTTYSTIKICHLDCCVWIYYRFVGESLFFKKLTQKYKVKMLLSNKKFFNFNFHGKLYILDDFVKQVIQRVPWIIVGEKDHNMKDISNNLDKVIEYSNRRRDDFINGDAVNKSDTDSSSGEDTHRK